MNETLKRLMELGDSSVMDYVRREQEKLSLKQNLESSARDQRAAQQLGWPEFTDQLRGLSPSQKKTMEEQYNQKRPLPKVGAQTFPDPKLRQILEIVESVDKGSYTQMEQALDKIKELVK